ncbi:hypothetical protein EIN_085610 [Entamoeba invadens IP1]|uniref:hypothetical protein n=1 Tax=Entamoeba invadens IP1 TaxID=370355 RepID=UPI0002C3E3D8|nr:hypothetical protein EIN_085610 [Entamoeba invadens IP1]ELP85319.1 hypothetical protein EIN_085610 [Entamoeba invadens IP1]|eukprot:XP_004184665.1 hypothetical protein EIN_085610 [Entamoeba invadens IP1]
MATTFRKEDLDLVESLSIKCKEVFKSLNARNELQTFTTKIKEMSSMEFLEKITLLENLYDTKEKSFKTTEKLVLQIKEILDVVIQIQDNEKLICLSVSKEIDRLVEQQKQELQYECDKQKIELDKHKKTISKISKIETINSCVSTVLPQQQVETTIVKNETVVKEKLNETLPSPFSQQWLCNLSSQKYTVDYTQDLLFNKVKTFFTLSQNVELRSDKIIFDTDCEQMGVTSSFIPKMVDKHRIAIVCAFCPDRFFGFTFNDTITDHKVDTLPNTTAFVIRNGNFKTYTTNQDAKCGIHIYDGTEFNGCCEYICDVGNVDAKTYIRIALPFFNKTVSVNMSKVFGGLGETELTGVNGETNHVELARFMLIELE